MHEFEIREEIVLEATPEQVWAAISTGPGVDSWLFGRSEIEPREGGRTSFTMGDETTYSTVTAWEPGRHLAYRSDENPDGTSMAFEYLIEGRAGGSTVLRFVHSGFLGDDWEAEYDALREGDFMYLRKLALYVKHFTGQTATHSMFAPGPQVDQERAWARFREALGLSGTPAEGDPVRVSVPGLAPVDGVAEAVRVPKYVVVRTADQIYVLMYAFGMVFAECHDFSSTVDEKELELAWQNWLAALPG
jgi:uncharacterized protein YndB with AHSA1/START domain